MMFSSCHNGDKELSQGEKVFLQYIQYRTISIPQEGHSFIYCQSSLVMVVRVLFIT